MDTPDTLKLSPVCPVKAQNAGLFISRGRGTHPTRIIDSHELIFVKQGQLELWEEDRQFCLEAGQTLHLWPSREHGGSKPMVEGLKFYWIHFELTSNSDETSSIDVPQVNSIRQPEKLESLFRYFLDEQESGILTPYGANLLMMLMLVEVARSSSQQDDEDDNANVIAARAHTYVRLHYDRPISAGKVAEALGYNPDYLGRVYRKVYSCTLTEAIHHRRIHIACHHLLESDMTIEQIAQTCGYTDPDYFRRIFRRYMQTSPGTYRNMFARVRVNTQ
jgi:AraC-like DNA-binding protein